VRTRLASRTDASLSDARWETYVAQRARREPLEGDEPAIGVDSGDGLDAARAAALRALWRWRQGRPLDARRSS
jgi:predicted kinase